LNQVRTGNARFKAALTLIVHMDNLICHNGAKITKQRPLLFFTGIT
jgi:hypothetical protein